jgi:hypothetical protein
VPDQHTNTITTTPDPESTGVHNPIHDADGAGAAGYAGALVAGVRTYGWAAATLTEVLGEHWLDRGWVDFSLKRPLYAGESLCTVVHAAADGWAFHCLAGDVDGQRVVLDGNAGLGDAPWLGELRPPAVAPALPALDTLPTYDLDTVPLEQALRPLGACVSRAAARAMVVDDLALDTARHLRDPTGSDQVHPYFLAGRMAPLTRHNFTYGPTIHVRSQIQHRREAWADRLITIGAQIVDAYDRNGHWYQVLDGSVTDEDGELARIRHHTIFSPRGTR